MINQQIHNLFNNTKTYCKNIINKFTRYDEIEELNKRINILENSIKNIEMNYMQPLIERSNNR